MSKKVALIMGSNSDFPKLKGCVDMLKKFGVEVDVMVCSAHRTPEKAAEIAKSAEKNGYGVIIGAAGKAAHLPGVLAAYTVLPVIGVPIRSSALDGMDALLSIVQMPAGIPVATVAIDGAENAAILAVQILSAADEDLKKKLFDYKVELKEKVEQKDAELQKQLKNLI